MNLTYYPFESFTIEVNKLTVIQCMNQRNYIDLLNGLRDLDDRVHLTDENHNRVDLTKGIFWIGDCFQIPDLNKLFQTPLQKKIIKEMNVNKLDRLVSLDQSMKSLIMDQLLTYDLPLTVNPEFSLANIMKLCNISFVNTLKTQPYDIIETVLKCASELNERSILVLTNVYQYLSVSQFQELVRLIETLDLSTLLIEFSEKKKSDYYANCHYYYIDQDFIDWRQE